MKLSFIILIIFTMLIMIGCSTKEVVITQEVYIPIKCDVEIPKKPNQTSYVNSVIDIIEYAEKLEEVVNVCVRK